MSRNNSSKIEKPEYVLDSDAASTKYVSELFKSVKRWKLF